jgi:hypothetical protein
MGSLTKRIDRSFRKKVEKVKKRLREHPEDVLRFKNREEAKHFMRTMYEKVHGKPMEGTSTWSEGGDVNEIEGNARLSELQKVELTALAEIEKEKVN